MSKVKFTKGMWYMHYGYVNIGDVNYTFENQFDAHLISEAPKMYEELENSRNMLMAVHNNTGSMGANAQAAIIDELLKSCRGE